MSFDFSKITSFLKKDIKVREAPTVLGIDIGSSAIKIVQLHDKHGTPMLDTYGELQLGPYAQTDVGRTTNLDTKRLIEAFVDIIRESAATSKDISLALSFNSSFATIIPVPTKDIEQIDAMIPVEARKYVPIPLPEVSLDWFPVSATSDNASTKVLIVAIHNEALKRYERIIKSANLEQKFLEVEIFSTIRAVAEGTDKTIAIIDFGAQSTKLYIVQNGIIGKSHSLKMSGSELTTVLADALKIDFKEAEGYKRKLGLLVKDSNPDGQKVLITHFERGLREIHMVMKRYNEEEKRHIDQVFVTGSGALLPGLTPYAAAMFEVPVTLANPFGKVAYPAFLEDTLRQVGPTFAVAIGAALRGMSSK